MNTIYRKELKYIIPVDKFRQLREKISVYLKQDKNMCCGYYKVRSLYFDTMSNDDLCDSVFGHFEKSKIRIRVYPPDLDRVILELKEKKGFDGVKTQVEITKKQAEELMKSKYAFLLEKNDESALKIFSKLSSNGYFPKSIVEYKRAAYLLPAGDTRITFDYHIGVSETVSNFFKKNIFATPAMGYSTGVLEVKYNSVLLGAVKDILKDIDDLTEANSKYVQSRLLL